MTIEELTLGRWRAATPGQRRSLAAGAAERVGAQEWDLAPDGATARLVLHGRPFALVPGGEARLGVDAASFAPTPEQAASYAESREDFGFPAEMAEYLAEVLSPPRTVRLPPLLVAVEPWAFEEEPEEIAGLLAAQGLRTATPDEWEWACGAGARTLFRWGADHPGTGSPHGSPDGPQHAPNAFGLLIGRDPYDPELTAEPGVFRGGDGGAATCGGYGSFLAWLPLATAYRDPGLGELLADGWPDDLLVRPVAEL
ncbi:hypothetical protein [Kitasatospora sp. NBC_01539]|uniref:hypothetical protein n=1 Tax=Kitasatospora sp. NBC_01539 TaxID=2903577 RepID=UPI003860114C